MAQLPALNLSHHQMAYPLPRDAPSLKNWSDFSPNAPIPRARIATTQAAFAMRHSRGPSDALDARFRATTNSFHARGNQSLHLPRPPVLEPATPKVQPNYGIRPVLKKERQQSRQTRPLLHSRKPGMG